MTNFFEALPSHKNIAHWKMTWCFLLMKRGVPRASPSFDACTSWIFLGVSRGHPQAWAFFHSSSYCITLLSLYLKTSFIQNSTQFISNISVIKIIKSIWFSMTYEKHILNISYCNTSFKKVLWSRELKKKGIKRHNATMAEICQNRTVRKDLFFRKCYAAQIEKNWTNES